MTRLSWDDILPRQYEFGVDRGVFYPQGAPGVPWNGLISVKERVTGDNDEYIYVDGVRVRQGKPQRIFDFGLTAFSDPNGVAADFRKEFGLCYRTKTEAGYQLHLLYNVMGGLQGATYETLNNGASAMAFTWALSARPALVPGVTPTGQLVVDSSVGYLAMLEDLESVLYGSDTTAPRLPTPVELLALVESHAILKITDNGDGTWTADGPAEALMINGDGTFQIHWPNALLVSPGMFTVSSL